MCGIVGVVGTALAAPLLLDGLKRLEYRGYDSAGIATLVGGRIERRRAEGKLTNLETLLQREPLSGTTGIGHTRWATHGAPTEVNAHPHATERVAVVHNGIIENFQELRAELEAKGRRFSTQTDTEVVAHLLTVYLDEGLAPEAAMEATLKRIEGAFAIAVLIFGREDVLLAARRGSPLALGIGEGGETQAPMGRAIIGGVITSTLLTLIVVPVLYTYLDALAEWRKARHAARFAAAAPQPSAGAHARAD